MISFFDVENLKELLRDFYVAVGIRISIFDDEFNMVAEYPEEAPEYCKLIRSTNEGKTGCQKCDVAACERAKKLRKPHIYTCHAGITEAITPIQLGGGVLGYAILAHMLPKEGCEEATIKACEAAEKYGVKKADGLKAISSITKKSTAEMRAAVSILDAVASFVYVKNLAAWKNEDISADIEKYVKANLSERLSNDALCKKFNVSRSSLYQISLKAFGMGIMQYVSYCRIEKAKALLLENKSVTEVADKCGYNEYTYFCKVFKETIGVSPSEYKKRERLRSLYSTKR